MSTLVKYSTPAERACGLSLALGFDSVEDVARAGGTISGTPTIAGGLATFNGTTGYITYALTGNEFNSAEISIVFEFWPDFDYDEDAFRVLFTSENNLQYSATKRNNANSNDLQIKLGDTAISIASASYSAYWRVGERNVLVISGTTGDTSAWLNGTQILTSDATAWTADTPVSFYVGAWYDGTLFFDGKIGPIKVFKGLLDGQDALNYYNKNTYSYRENCVLHLPMRASEHDATGVRTLDISGNDNHADLGDGSTPSTYPTKTQSRGYFFDGTTDYITLDGGFDFGTDDFSIFALLRGADASTYRAIIYNMDGGTSGIALQAKLTTGVFRAWFDDAGYEGIVNILDGSWHTVGVVRDGDILNMYVDGRLDASHAGVAAKDGSSSIDAVIGKNNGGGSYYWNGDMKDFFVRNSILTHLQAADLHIRMLKEINNV